MGEFFRRNHYLMNRRRFDAELESARRADGLGSTGWCKTCAMRRGGWRARRGSL